MKTEQKKTPELKPCPFCGGEAEITYVCGEYAVMCKSCKGSSDFNTNTSKSISRWNTRVYPEDVQKAVISQTPRLVTVLKTERGGKNFFCPACANDVHFTYSHCTCCGQRLDWSDE